MWHKRRKGSYDTLIMVKDKKKNFLLSFWQSLKKRTFSFVTLQYPYVRTSENKRFVCLLDNHATMAKRSCINFGTWTFSYLHRILPQNMKKVILCCVGYNFYHRKYTWFCDKPYSKRTGPLMGTWWSYIIGQRKQVLLIHKVIQTQITSYKYPT